jgi:hypothetical protein
MTEMDPEMYPPTNSAEMNAKEMAMTMYSLQKFLE